MVAENIYHGTSRERGEQLLANQQMVESRGDDHWLGDGSYFFVEEFYAYKWILDMYRARVKEPCTFDSLKGKYMILTTLLKPETRFFDLTKAEGKILYDSICKQMKEKADQSERLQIDKFADGVVLNYMFKKLEYFRNSFDVVKAIFRMNVYNHSIIKSRIDFIPQEQWCIKNPNVISNIIEFNYNNEEARKYTSLIQGLDPSYVKKEEKGATVIYKISSKKRYGKRKFQR